MTQPTQSTLIGVRFKPERNKWEARIKLQGKSISRLFSTVEEAVAWRKSMQEPKTVETLLTCADLFPKWLESLKNDCDKSPQTYERYENMVRLYILPFFGKNYLKEVTDSLVMNFIVSIKEMKREKPLSSKSIKNTATALSTFFEYCIIRGLISLNPAKSPLFRQNLSRFVKEKKKFEQNIRDKARSFDEIKILLNASYQKNYEFGLFVELLISTGLRLGEAASLTWGDLTQSKNENEFYYSILVNKTLNLKTKQIQNSAKCGSNATLPIPYSLANKIKAWSGQLEIMGFENGKSDFIFPKITRSAHNFSQDLVSLCQKIGIKNTTAHCLRHSFVTLLATSGHDVQQVQRMARHSTVTMTMAYYQPSFQQLNPMIQTMDNMLGKLASQQ